MRLYALQAAFASMKENLKRECRRLAEHPRMLREIEYKPKG